MKLIRTITLPQYPTHVQLSKKRRVKWKEKWKDGKMQTVIANPRAAGTPSYQKIKGQDIYSGNMHQHTRAKVVEAMSGYIQEHIVDIEPVPIEDFPVVIRCEVHTVLNQDSYRMVRGELQLPKAETSNIRWDVGNMWIWSKVFDDTIKGKIIPEDDYRFVIGTGEMLLIPIKDFNERKLVFKIYKYE